MKSIFLKIILPALLTLIVGYVLGVTEHKRTADWEKKKLVHEQQVKVWQSLSTDFPKYLVGRSRLRDISEAQSNSRNKIPIDEKKKIEHRKERYLEERDSARSALMSDLEQAKLVFPKCISLIEKYEELEINTRILTPSKLPPESDWRNYMKSILEVSFAGRIQI